MKITINTKEVWGLIKKGYGAQQIGFVLLDQAADAMAATLNGDSAENNVALRAFEQALDWRLGILAVEAVKKAPERGRHFLLHLEVKRNGDIVGVKSGAKYS